MYYYLVWVRSNRFHGSEPLTYAHTTKLQTGQIIQVELQKELVTGVISGVVTEPRFKTKPISHVYDLPSIPAHLLKLSQWLLEYYPAPLGIVAQQLVPAQFSAKQLAIPTPGPFTAPITDQLPALTAEQQAALAAVVDGGRNTYLLHGRTGSGKTRIYIELALRTLAKGKSVLILTPEISLTSQLANNLRAVFGERVLVFHSQQAPAERQGAWLTSLRSQEPLVIIGPRSALFCPLAKPGLIIMDESHEAAYKQDQAPHYQTGRVAAYLAGLTRSSLILGSATPSVADYYLAEQKQRPIINLLQLAVASNVGANQYVIVDRKEHQLFSRSSYLSQPLLQAMEGALGRGEQILLYLNRRGTARLVMCQNCGWQANCPHCDIPLTYHGDSHQLRCHACDHHESAPASCPNCGHPDVVYKTAGTKAIAAEVSRLFPQARVARFDTDNAKAERFEQHYEAIHAGSVDVLVGTQLLAKGLDLPKLSTLGILLADTSLYVADYTAQERTFQLLSQVLGRIGRGHVAGRAIIQTYHPDHPVISAAIQGDYAGFYKTELIERRQFLFPPFCYLLKLSVRRASSKAAEKAATTLHDELLRSGRRVQVEGPAPSFYEKAAGKYQWQLIIKAMDRSQLLQIIANLPANWTYDIDPSDLL
jgi:primosomal protein N' (replication factor Y)